jgi:hypothetical protein
MSTSADSRTNGPTLYMGDGQRIILTDGSCAEIWHSKVLLSRAEGGAFTETKFDLDTLITDQEIAALKRELEETDDMLNTLPDTLGVLPRRLTHLRFQTGRNSRRCSCWSTSPSTLFSERRVGLSKLAP